MHFLSVPVFYINPITPLMNTLLFHHDDAGWARRFALGTSDKYVSSYIKYMDLRTQMNLFMGHSLSQDIV